MCQPIYVESARIDIIDEYLAIGEKITVGNIVIDGKGSGKGIGI